MRISFTRLRTQLILPALAAFVVAAAPVCAAIGPDVPADFDAIIRQGRAAFFASDADGAEAAYNQACPADLVTAYPVAKAVTCENLLASVDEARGNLARAEQRNLQAVSGAEQAGPAYQPLYCAKLIDLGEFYRRHGRTTEAEASLTKAVDIARKLTSVVPGLLPQALIRLGAVYSDMGQSERARAPLTEVLTIVATPQVDGKPIIPPAETAFAHDAMGIIELGNGNIRAAETHLRAAVALATDALGEDSQVMAFHQANLALVLIAGHRLDAARLLLRRAQYVLEARNGRPTMQLALIYVEMSSVASGEGKMAEAEDYAQRAISMLNTLPKSDVRALASAQVMLAGIYLRNHDTAAAGKMLPAAVEIQRETGASPNSLGASIRLLGELRMQQRNWQDAEKLFRESIGIYEKTGTENMNAAVVPVLRDLADVLKHQGAPKDEVRALESQARDILRTVPAPSGKQPTPRA